MRFQTTLVSGCRSQQESNLDGDQTPHVEKSGPLKISACTRTQSFLKKKINNGNQVHSRSQTALENKTKLKKNHRVKERAVRALKSHSWNECQPSRWHPRRLDLGNDRVTIGSQVESPRASAVNHKCETSQTFGRRRLRARERFDSIDYNR